MRRSKRFCPGRCALRRIFRSAAVSVDLVPALKAPYSTAALAEPIEAPTCGFHPPPDKPAAAGLDPRVTTQHERNSDGIAAWALRRRANAQGKRKTRAFVTAHVAALA